MPVPDDSRISSGIANHKSQFLSGIILTWNPDNSTKPDKSLPLLRLRRHHSLANCKTRQVAHVTCIHLSASENTEGLLI
jgi:hypothetical protein